MWIYMIIIAAVVALDQLTKVIVMNTMAFGESVELIPGVFRFTYILNDGMAFGLLDSQRWIFMSVSVLAIAAIIFYMWKYRPDNKMALWGMSLVIGGGVGNMIDRLFYGEGFGNGAVVDFLDFCAFPRVWKYIFNVADACVCIGAGLIMLYLVLDIVKTSKEEKAAAQNTDAAEEVNDD